MPYSLFGTTDDDFNPIFTTGAVNQPGVSQTSWNSCFSCSNALNQCTKVPGSPNATDQFSLYRGDPGSTVPVLAQCAVQCRDIRDAVVEGCCVFARARHHDGVAAARHVRHKLQLSIQRSG